MAVYIERCVTVVDSEELREIRQSAEISVPLCLWLRARAIYE